MTRGRDPEEMKLMEPRCIIEASYRPAKKKKEKKKQVPLLYVMSRVSLAKARSRSLPALPLLVNASLKIFLGWAKRVKPLLQLCLVEKHGMCMLAKLLPKHTHVPDPGPA
ncbi:conserved hypothetical protein [Ricinus communis]|uniref:Uncharacterized protein n=1 Tax=Ricinus communis TaxID=3988 RepID=B9RV32_RICCO|nr:conserved hypothetical protein [Ricinus communis]